MHIKYVQSPLKSAECDRNYTKSHDVSVTDMSGVYKLPMIRMSFDD